MRGEDGQTGNVNYVWDVFLTVYRGKIGDCTPCDAMWIPCNTDDADIRGRREVLDCIRSVSISFSVDESAIPFSELPTAPQPVSPKLTMTLCFNAAYICFELRTADCLLRWGKGKNSTRIHRFCDRRWSAVRPFSYG